MLTSGQFIVTRWSKQMHFQSPLSW